jgi:pyruvate kinase
MLKRTKIIATLGPSTDEPGMLLRMIESGVDLVRVNLSHGVRASHQKRIELTRLCSVELNKEVGIIVDLQGPKIRIARFKEGSVFLTTGAQFIIDADFPLDAGTVDCVGIDYKRLPQEVYSGDILLLDDGLIMLSVQKVEASRIHTIVKLGGKLSNNKGINRRGGGLTATPLTPKDLEDIEFAAKMNVDYVAVSFPRSADDLHQTRKLLEKSGSRAGVIAKIERVEAIEALDEIIESSDAVMVARGDLGVEVGYAELPGIQKHIIVRSHALNRPVITATQMMESMVHSPIPTRAEVSDVANAVLDGSDAVMFSAETATGDYPDKAVNAMHEVCLAVERQKSMHISHHRLESRFKRIDESIAMAAMYVANHIDTRAIVALTETGSTPLWMSRISSAIPIYGLSRNKDARGRMTLYRGVYPIDFDVTRYPKVQVTQEALAELLRLGVIKQGDQVVITKGDIMGNSGGANTLKVVIV